MVEMKIRTRPIGAAAVVGRSGHPIVTSETDETLEVVNGVSEAGFSPLDLMFSSLAACLALSGRIAASRLGLLDRLDQVSVYVTGEKAHEGASRITRFIIDFNLEGDLNSDEKAHIVHMAEDICTVSNTLKGSPAFSINAG